MLDPVQFSATSHTPAAARHSVPELATPSTGQAVLDPVQVSATSHTPAEPRQTVVLNAKPSAGQLALE